jgi:hypothetical protein
MADCKRSCLHRSSVMEYRTARLAGEQQRDEAVGVYGYDSEEWASYPPAITFKDWLQQMRGPT